MTFEELSEIHQHLEYLKNRRLPHLKSLIQSLGEQRRVLEGDGLFTGFQPVIVNPYGLFNGKTNDNSQMLPNGHPGELVHSKLQSILKRHIPGMLREVELFMQAEAKDIAIEIDSLEAQLKAVLDSSPAAEKEVPNG